MAERSQEPSNAEVHSIFKEHMYLCSSIRAAWLSMPWRQGDDSEVGCSGAISTQGTAVAAVAVELGEVGHNPPGAYNSHGVGRCCRAAFYVWMLVAKPAGQVGNVEAGGSSSILLPAA